MSDGFQVIEAEDFDEGNSIMLVSDGSAVGYFDEGSYLLYSDVNFGETAVNSVTIELASINSGGVIEIRLGSVDGQSICSHSVISTQSWSDYESQSLNCETTAGVHDIYIVGAAGVGIANIDYIQFSSEEIVQPIIELSRTSYANKLAGFWLGQCIGNWTGLVTEMDKIGGPGVHGEFYTREDWGQPDQPAIWGNGQPSNLSPTIDFVYEDESGTWGSDDDTDIEFIYHHLLLTLETSVLTGEQVRQGWLTHIYEEEENYLWASNQKVYDLMLNEGLAPPATSEPQNNDSHYFIDAQLTTEIFGFYAPARPKDALEMAHMPIRAAASGNAEWAAEFNVIMYSLASYADTALPIADRIKWMADAARQRLPNDSYSALMYDFVKSRYEAGVSWEQARDDIYLRYQVEQSDGYDVTSKNLYCNGCFASGINFAASIVSLLYGEGDIQETIKIATLAGWDSDNPAATWAGLLGFMIGKDGVEAAFGRKFSNTFNIHRTRRNFPNDGIYTFDEMAAEGLQIIDRVVVEKLDGEVDLENDNWLIPDHGPVVRPN